MARQMDINAKAPWVVVEKHICLEWFGGDWEAYQRCPEPVLERWLQIANIEAKYPPRKQSG